MDIDTLPTTGYHVPVTDSSKWMTIKQACEHLKISRTALYKAIETGDIERSSILDKPVVRKSDVMKYVPRNYPKRTEEEESKP